MPFQEYAHDFGAVTASTATQFSLEVTFRGNADVPRTARIPYAIVRNNSAGSVTVNPGAGQSVVGVGERKRIEFKFDSKFFTIVPSATVNSGELTADIGLDGVTL